MTIAIYRFPDMATSWDASDDTGTLSWSSTQPRSVVGHLVMEAAEMVLRVHGEAGYLQKWAQHPSLLPHYRTFDGCTGEATIADTSNAGTALRTDIGQRHG
ncbi:hypothetical protein ACF06X_18495 [Streptomyces sp. NPDC015346]|uniref:hypothetical protein n=1 Tax=Streptomyces sp. NPDC015346 TaxID=3364954 RepID=UPI00370013E4